jgi:cation diffusion facilitator CzcD-associated flavoprotein CzcO
MTPPTDTSVIVVGAGQAGLSVAFYLKRLGLKPGTEFVVLDRGPSSGGAWQHRWDALRLGSAHRVNDLPGMGDLGLSFETADHKLPASGVVADYYSQYERHFELDVVRPASVTGVRSVGERLEASVALGSTSPATTTITTDFIVNATGTWGSPFIPWYPGRTSFRGEQIHTAEYRAASEFAGRNVVVVGGGTSAIGFLLELEGKASSLTWVTRRPVEFRDQGKIDLEAGAAAVADQDAAARAGEALPSIVSGTGVPRTRRMQAAINRGMLVAQPMFESIEPKGIRWADGTFQRADVIIWATGFRPELRHLAPLGLRETTGGVQVTAGVAGRDPRIFFAGYGPQASTAGAQRSGRSIARRVVAAMSRPRP